MVARESPSVWQFVGVGLLAGALYATLDLILDAMIGAGTLTGSLELAHSMLAVALPVLTGSALGFVMHSRRDRALLALRERHRAESLGLQLDRARRAQAVWVMAASVLHEVNNPLHAMGLLLDEALEQGDTSPATLERLRVHVDRIAEHVGTLRALPRAGAPLSSPVPMAELLTSVLEERRSSLGRLVLHIELDDALIALADSNHTRIIVENLIDNAVHALETVQTPTLSIRGVRRAGEIELRVQDNGVAITRDPHSLFEAFHSTRDGGLGLGLPIARALAKAMNGDVELEQHDQRHKIFLLRLPARVSS